MCSFLFIQFAPILLYGLVLLGGSFLIGVIIGFLSPSDAKRIAIFGSRSSGKTTLWKQLKNEFSDSITRSTLDIESLENFEIEYDGKKKTIISPKDYSGSETFVKDYDRVIEKGTFIYYLVDLNTLSDLKKDTRARLLKIAKVIKEKSLKKEDYGFRLVATHYKEYHDKTNKSKEDARKELINVLELGNMKETIVDPPKTVMVAELTDSNDIEQFRKQIVES